MVSDNYVAGHNINENEAWLFLKIYVSGQSVNWNGIRMFFRMSGNGLRSIMEFNHIRKNEKWRVR